MKNKDERVRRPRALKCREAGCHGRIPTKTKTLESATCKILGLCRYCYRAMFPKREMWNLPEARHGAARVLTYDDRKRIERNQFSGVEQQIWDPAFYKEWKASLMK